MDLLPIRAGDDMRSSRTLAKASRLQQRTELALFERSLEIHYMAEVDRIESQAISDVLQCSLEEEYRLLDYGMSQAAGSQAKLELLARKSATQSQLNNARIARKFGA